jgi:lipopolysaccharide transport system permease protein
MDLRTTIDAAPRGGAASDSWAAEFDIVLEPTTGLRAFRFGDLVRFRELLYFLTWRDIKVRYKQTALGAGWAILAYVALVPWLFFANGVQLSATSLTVNPTLITKVYFPRLYLVMAPIVAGLVDFALALLVLVGMMVWYGVLPSAAGTALLLPFLLLGMMTTVGASTWLAALNVKYRDVRFVVPFLVQILLFATPVVYSTSSVRAPWQMLFGLNPMTSVVEGFRWALAGASAPHASTVALSAIVGVGLFVSGFRYFHRTEKNFADLI